MANQTDKVKYQGIIKLHNSGKQKDACCQSIMTGVKHGFFSLNQLKMINI